MTPFTLAAQVSTSHSANDSLSLSSVLKVLREAQEVIPFSAFILGAREIPEIFNGLTKARDPKQPEVYIWYNLLSDYPGQKSDESVVDFKGESSTGWQGWDSAGESEVEESFVFSCPNNPETRRKTLAGLENLLIKYPFDGVFLDKIRFPSPANNLDMVFSCFCPHCRQKALSQGLDLEQVRNLLKDGSSFNTREMGTNINWLDALAVDRPLLKQFIRFRCESITSLVADVRKLTTNMNRRLALDLFTPLLAPLVGQDYAALSKLADWAKPMAYRYAYGPAGIRLEVEKLVSGLQKNYNLPLDILLEWMGHSYPGVSPQGYSLMLEKAAPLEWVRHEYQQAVRDFQPKPILMGLETVSFPGVIDIKPDMVKELVKTGLESNVQGAVISWDLMHTPLENINAIKSSL
jgi:hypothetical protein